MILRVHFAIASLAILVLCGTNYWVEYTPTWKEWQEEYYALLAEKIKDPQKAARVANTPPDFVQIYNQELGVTDRCVICHLGMDNPLMAGERNPHKLHPGNLLASHPYQQVGCTICHHGQGSATTLDDAHGHVPHWERPLLTGDFVQATCTKCHNEDEVPDAPVLTRGKRLLRELGCVGCHRTGDAVEQDKVGPRLAAVGSKVSRTWLNKWLANPKNYLPAGKMPHYHLRSQAANALAAYLMTFKNKAIDEMAEPEGDYDAGAFVYRESQCTVCHVTLTREDSEGNLVPIGGTIGPDLRKIGNKVNQRWLVAFLKDPHAFYPNTAMPRFHFTEKQVLDLSQYVIEEWVDFDLLDAEEAEPEPPPDSPGLIEQGRLLYSELGCGGCHDLTGEATEPPGPNLTFIGSKPVHDLDFGDAELRHTLPDFLYTKLKSPQSLSSDFRLPLGEDPAAAIWKNVQPTALFSNAADLPEGSDSERLAWILHQVQERTAPPPDQQAPAATEGADEEQEGGEQDDEQQAGQDEAERQQGDEAPEFQAPAAVDRNLKLPDSPAEEQAAWLVQILNEAGLLNPLKMPDFLLSNADAEALTIALMSLSAVRVSSRRYEVPRKRTVSFNPKDEFGRLERRYRCLSCHSIRGSGDLLASDLTFEGNRVNREWLYHYLKKPYSMRRMIVIAMPNFNFPDEESRFMAEYMSRVFVDSRIGVGWKRLRNSADAGRGKALFDAKGCIACHQLHDQGGDIGPSLTTQVPEFPQGTWVGDKLRGEWIYAWLKDPHSLLPGTLEPNLGLSDQEAADLTAYLLSLKNPEYRPKN